MEPRLILVNLLIKLGVAAALSSALVRSKEFKNLIFREQRETRHKIYLALWMAIPITLGVWIRVSVKSFLAGDLSLETAGETSLLTMCNVDEPDRIMHAILDSSAKHPLK